MSPNACVHIRPGPSHSLLLTSLAEDLIMPQGLLRRDKCQASLRVFVDLDFHLGYSGCRPPHTSLLNKPCMYRELARSMFIQWMLIYLFIMIDAAM